MKVGAMTDSEVATPAMDRLMRGERGLVRDRVLTIAFGDLDRDGRKIDGYSWRALRHLARVGVEMCGGTVYAITEGPGVGSDGVNAGESEGSMIVLAGNVRDVAKLRRYVAALLRDIDASSACFALDSVHEPVFAHNEDGSR